MRLSPAEPSPGQRRADLEAVVSWHFGAIRGRDLDRLAGTLIGGEDLTLIFPDGTRLETRRQFIDVHTGWFADPDWTMEVEPAQTLVGGDAAVVPASRDAEGQGLRS